MNLYSLTEDGRQKSLSIIRDLPSQTLLLSVSTAIFWLTYTRGDNLSFITKLMLFSFSFSVFCIFFYSIISIFKFSENVNNYYKNHGRTFSIAYWTEILIITLTSVALISSVIILSANAALQLIPSFLS